MYDTLGRLTEWRQSAASDVTSVVINYAYDVDNNVISVSRSDDPVTWYRHEVTSGDDSEVSDGDGLVVLRRGVHRLEWNSRSQLVRASATSGDLNSTYIYDAVGRLTVVNSVQSSVQLFYSDLDRPDRLTHVYHSDSTTQAVIEYFYDLQDGHLLAARLNAHVMFYVAVDPHGSPVCVFNETGHIVRQMSYTPFGRLRPDTGNTSSADTPSPPWYIGYRAAFHDVHADLLFFGSQVFDADTGRWLSPNYQPFTDRQHHTLTSFIHYSDLYENNFLRHGDVTPPSLMLSKLYFMQYNTT